MQDAVKLLLLQDEQTIETLTSHTSGETFTNGIGTRGVLGRCEQLDATGPGNPREGHATLALVITDEVLRSHPTGRGFSKRYARSMRKSGQRVTPAWITVRECRRVVVKKAKSDRKKRSGIGRKSQGQIC